MLLSCFLGHPVLATLVFEEIDYASIDRNVVFNISFFRLLIIKLIHEHKETLFLHLCSENIPNSDSFFLLCFKLKHFIYLLWVTYAIAMLLRDYGGIMSSRYRCRVDAWLTRNIQLHAWCRWLFSKSLSSCKAGRSASIIHLWLPDLWLKGNLQLRLHSTVSFKDDIGYFKSL